MDRYEAARALGVADGDVVEVETSEHGTAVTLNDGGVRLINSDGHFAIGDHSATAHLRRFEPPTEDVPAAEPAEEPTGEAAGAKKAPTRSRKSS